MYYHLDHVILELTSECNLHCRHCYNWWKQESREKQHFNSYRKAFKLLQYLFRNTTVERIVFSGGEPTLSERFIELVLHAKIHQKKVTVITNGNGSSETYHQLASLGTDLLEFSIHSSHPEIHDQITGIPGSWEKAVRHLRQMMQSGLSVVPVIVITKYNYQTIPETVAYFHEMGLHSFMVNRYNIGGAGLNGRTSLSATARQLREVFQALNTYAGEHRLHLVSGVCTPHCLLNPGDYPNIGFGSCSEDIYKRPLTFDIDGNLRLCNHSPQIAGNIYRESLNTILTSAYVQAWTDTPVAFCQNCPHWSNCKAGCRAAAEQTGLTLADPDPIIKELGLEPFTDFRSVTCSTIP